MDPALWELLRTGTNNDTEEIEAIIRIIHPQLKIPGVHIISRFGSIATCRLRKNLILRTRQEKNVRSLKASRVMGSPEDELKGRNGTSELPLTPLETDERRPRGLSLTGAGVVIGIVDWGCDFDHPNLKHPDGSTRLIALWDQRGPPPPGTASYYGYGTIYSRRQINHALSDAEPYRMLGYHPGDADQSGLGAHGMHCIDIAAGNGLGGGPVGIAPEADLIFVHLADSGTGGLANLGDSLRILEAIDFIDKTAGSRPWVINLSVGKHGGPHDGTTLVELALDFILDAAPSKFIVQSAGNYFDKCVHASGRLRAGEERILELLVDKADITPR